MVARGSDKSSTLRLPPFSVEAIAQDELVGPGDGVAGLILAGRVHHEEVDAQGVWW